MLVPGLIRTHSHLQQEKELLVFTKRKQQMVRTRTVLDMNIRSLFPGKQAPSKLKV